MRKQWACLKQVTYSSSTQFLKVLTIGSYPTKINSVSRFRKSNKKYKGNKHIPSNFSELENLSRSP